MSDGLGMEFESGRGCLIEGEIVGLAYRSTPHKAPEDWRTPKPGGRYCAPLLLRPLLLELTGPASRGEAAGMKESAGVTHVSFVDAVAKGPPPPGNLAVPIFAHGSLVVELYQPAGVDPQKPHTRDEVYFVARGNGFFFDGERRDSIGPGSFIFVPAGHVHRFEDFSADLVVWVAFYGPEGGEGM